jgi:hypothetical protein
MFPNWWKCSKGVTPGPPFQLTEVKSVKPVKLNVSRTSGCPTPVEGS